MEKFELLHEWSSFDAFSGHFVMGKIFQLTKNDKILLDNFFLQKIREILKILSEISKNLTNFQQFLVSWDKFWLKIRKFLNKLSEFTWIFGVKSINFCNSFALESILPIKFYVTDISTHFPGKLSALIIQPAFRCHVL